ncbi:hypothetical protein LUZ60_017739 [Juncus effusus]|nr:hypothetical protein LUZ60_017739 [Juncus effusus]
MVETVVGVVASRLTDLKVGEFFSQYGVQDQIESLEREHKKVESFLKDFEGHVGWDEMTRLWVKEAIDLSYAIEDVLERFLMEIEGDRQIQGGFLNRLKNISRRTITLPVQETLAKDITKINAKISDLRESRSIYMIENLGELDRPKEASPSRPLRPGHEMVGFEAEERKIMSQLLDGNPKHSVISIVGPGGIGKSTLAQKIINSELVGRNFDFAKSMSLPELGKYEKSELKEKKYLICLDPVGSNDSWNELVKSLPNFRNGSRILITTRFFDVTMKANVQHSLPFLSDEESRQLLLKEALLYQSPIENQVKNLGDIPIKLARQCGGLPLALSVVGGILSKKSPTLDSWEMVLKTWDWHSDGKECMDILATSYEELPDYLKYCFMYFACFRKDEEIQAKSLIRMWLAEGFIPTKVTRPTTSAMPEVATTILETPEETANSWLEKLVQRCLIQVTKRYSNGNIKSCRIHVVFHELAIGKAKESNFLLVYKSDTLARDLKVARRVAFHYEVDGFNTFEENMLQETLMPNARSFFVSDVCIPIGRTLRFLKVLELRGTKDLKDLPQELMYMIFLRYLGLRSTGVTKIPKTIDNLGNLRTFDVRDTLIESLPDSLWGIKPLRHVHVSDRLDQVDGPPPSANLQNIQSLKTVRVLKAWRSKGLPLLPSVRSFGISCHRIIDEPDLQPYWVLVNRLLDSLENLVSLTIRGPYIPGGVIDNIRSFQNMKSLFLCGSGSRLNLDSFQMPPNLIKLKLQQFVLDKDPMPILQKLRGLKTLRLIWLTVPCEMKCSAEWYPQLERFEMVFLSGLENWTVDEGAMPMLKKLLIGSCFKLKVLPNLKYLNNLREFSLSNPSDTLKEKLIQNPTDCVPSGYQLSYHGSAGFRLSSVS